MSKKENGEAHEFFEFAESLVKQTGELALKYYGRGDPQFKFDEELVTELRPSWPSASSLAPPSLSAIQNITFSVRVTIKPHTAMANAVFSG
jgi:hypothetical protein